MDDGKHTEGRSVRNDNFLSQMMKLHLPHFIHNIMSSFPSYKNIIAGAASTPKWSGGTLSQSLDRITLDPQIRHGQSVIRGLWYPVETMLELMST